MTNQKNSNGEKKSSYKKPNNSNFVTPKANILKKKKHKLK